MNTMADCFRNNGPVNLALDEFEVYLDDAARDARRTIYAALLNNLCHMLLTDVGPTLGLQMLEQGCLKLRKLENSVQHRTELFADTLSRTEES